MTARSRTRTVARYDWAAVKERTVFDPRHPEPIVGFDVWEWDVFRLKWTRMPKAGGLGYLATASRLAEQRSNDIAAMLVNNREIPPKLG